METSGWREEVEVSDFPPFKEARVHSDSWEWVVGGLQEVEPFLLRPQEREKFHQWSLTCEQEYLARRATLIHRESTKLPLPVVAQFFLGQVEFSLTPN